MKGFLPWAVPEIRPKTVAALIVNESPSNPVPSVDVIEVPTSTSLNGQPVDLYETEDLPWAVAATTTASSWR